ARIEGAFLANDRINHAGLDLGPDLLIFGHAKIRKCVTLERQATTERRLADQKGCPGVMMARGNPGKAYECGGVGGLRAEVGRHGGNQIPLLASVKNSTRID